MIVFNLWAIPVGVVIYLVLQGIEHFYPSLTTGVHFDWTLGVVVTVVGGITELVGAKGRVFFVPIWMVGAGIICFHMGWIGSAVFLLLVILGEIVLFRNGKKKEETDWDKVQLALIKAPAAPIDGTEAQFWAWVKSMLFLPIWMNFTPEVCDHNLRVVEALKDTKGSFSNAEFQTVEALEKFLKDAKAAPKPVGSDMKLQALANDLVRKKVRRADKKKKFRVELPPPIFARG